MSPVTVVRRLPGFRDCREMEAALPERRAKRHEARTTNSPWRRHQKLSVPDRPYIPEISERVPPMQPIWNNPMRSFSVRQITPPSISLAHPQLRHGIIPRFRRGSGSKRMPPRRQNQMSDHSPVCKPRGQAHLRPVMCSSRLQAHWCIRQTMRTWTSLR